MAAERPQKTTRLLDATVVSWLLRLGLIGSAALLAVGLVLQLVAGDMVARPMTLIPQAPGAERSWGEVVTSLGVLLLALTPVARAAMLVGLWIKEKDWRFVLVAAAVLCVLGVAVALGV